MRKWKERKNVGGRGRGKKRGIGVTKWMVVKSGLGDKI